MLNFGGPSQKTANLSTQPGITQSYAGSMQQPMTFEDLDFLFGADSQPMKEEAYPPHHHESTSMDIEFDQPSDCIANRNELWNFHRQQYPVTLPDDFADSMDFEKLLAGFDDEDQILEGNLEAPEEEEIDFMFPDLPEDPLFQFPSFNKPEKKMAPSHHFATNHLYHNNEPNFAPQNLPYSQFSTYGNSINPFNSTIGTFPQPSLNSISALQPPQTNLCHQSQSFPFSNFENSLLHLETKMSFAELFKFRQGQENIFTSAGPTQTSLSVGLSKMVLALKKLFDSMAQVRTLYKAVSHLIVVHKLADKDVVTITGVNKRGLHSRAGKILYSKVLAKLVVAVSFIHSDPDMRDFVWKLIGSCI